MQNIENDMDDLFRRAAENYPLTTGKGDWDKIDKKLAVLPVSSATGKIAKNTNYKKLFFLLLLFASLILFVMLLKQPGNKLQLNVSSGSQKQQLVSRDQEAKKEITDNQANHNTVANHSGSSGVEKEKNKNDLISKETAVKSKNHFVKADQSFIYSEIYDQQVQNKPRNPQETIEKPDDLPNEKSGKDSYSNKSVFIAKKGKLKPISTQNHFYAELITNVDFNKVKTTHFEGPGFGVGIMAGYQLKRFFVETGIVVFRKNYYSLGNAFSEKDASMPAGMVINDLESRAKLLEIPVKAGFCFYDAKRIKYFVAAGASAYIMMNEKNNYNVTMNGAPEKMIGVYKKNSTKIPAVLNIGAGLEHNISGSLKIIVEPYLKLPLQGIGVGKLPVTSAGIQIGISGNLK